MNVHLDSMQWIYFFEQNPLFLPQTRSMILRAQAARSAFPSSNLIMGELLFVPKRNGDIFKATKYRRFY